jgi:hypothetical protein
MVSRRAAASRNRRSTQVLQAQPRAPEWAPLGRSGGSFSERVVGPAVSRFTRLAGESPSGLRSGIERRSSSPAPRRPDGRDPAGAPARRHDRGGDPRLPSDAGNPGSPVLRSPPRVRRVRRSASILDRKATNRQEEIRKSLADTTTLTISVEAAWRSTRARRPVDR